MSIDAVENGTADAQRLGALVRATATHAVSTFDGEGRITGLNPAAERMTGYRADELVGELLTRFYTPEDIAAGVPAEVLERAVAEGHVAGEAWRVRKDGSRFWASFEMAAVRDEGGRLLGFGEIARDAVERPDAGAEPPGRAEELATILRSIGDAVVVTDAEGRVTMLNPVAEALTGYTQDEARGRPLGEVFHIVNEDTRAPVDNPVARVLREGVVFGLANHTTLIAKDGTERPIADSAAPVRDGGATRGTVLVFRDQTEERVAERALRESEERFRLMVESCKDYAIFMLDPTGRVASWNAGAQRTKGYSADEIVGQHFSRFYPPEDVRAGKPAHLLSVAAAKGRVEDEGFRVKKDGTLFWADVVITALRDATGALRGFGKVTRDLTERKRAEEEIRTRAEELATILRSIGDGVLVTDAEGRVAMLNPVAEALTGFTQDEARGRPLAEIFHIVNEYTRAPVDNPVARVLREGLVVGLANHTVLIAKDGTERPIADSAAPVRDGGGTRGVVLVFRDQTEERAAERALRESEERFRLMVECCTDYAIFMLDPTGRVASWNAGAERIKGYRADEIIGQHFSRFYLPEEVRAGKPAHELEVAAAEGRFEDEGYRVRKDGSLIWANVIITPLRDETGALRGFGKVTRDLTERKRGEEQRSKLAAEQAAAAESARASRYLAEAGAALATSLDREATLQSLAGVLVPTFADWCAIDLLEEGRIRSVAVAHVDPGKVELARELQRRYPADPEAPFGVASVLRTGAAELYPDIPASMLDAVSRDAGMRATLAGLGLRSAMVVPLVARGRVLGAVTLVRAESDQRYDDKDLAIARDLGLRAGLAVDNARLYEEARRAISIRDEFLSIASHELRTPLTALQLQLQALRRLLGRASADPAQVAERLDKAIAFGGRFDALVRDLLDVTRIAAGRLGLDVKEVDVTAVTREVVERFSDEAARAGSTLELRDRGPVVVACDRARIDQVLTNLLANAVKYGAGKPVRVTVAKEGDRAVILVRDEGVGVALELHRRIFERFERGVSDRNHGGFGLGLWIAREIVLAHGGAIDIESAPGAGSTFRVELPLPIGPRVAA